MRYRRHMVVAHVDVHAGRETQALVPVIEVVDLDPLDRMTLARPLGVEGSVLSRNASS